MRRTTMGGLQPDGPTDTGPSHASNRRYSWSAVVVAAYTVAACAGGDARLNEAHARTPNTPSSVIMKPDASTEASEAAIEVAVTFDDLPSHGPLPAGSTRISIIERLLATFRKHRLPPVTGFVNGVRVEEHPGDRAALQAWVAAGQRLGSHTYSHANVNKIGLDAYLTDIDRNEPLLAELVPSGDYRTFRYPFLEEGPDLGTRNAIRQHLSTRGYRVGSVTIDFGDWAWNEPYGRCLARKGERATSALRKSYIQNSRVFLRWSVAAAKQIYRRPIRHVLLLHVGAFDAEMLDELLTGYEKAGVVFVSLDAALSDPVYAEPLQVAPTWGSGLLEQVIDARNAAHPPFPLQPLELLDALCR